MPTPVLPFQSAPGALRAARQRLQRRPRGFSLLEQVAVIAAAAGASAVALPQFVDLQAQTEATALASLAGAAGSAMVLNQAACLISGQRPRPGGCSAVADCADAAGLLMTDLPAGYRIAPQAILAREGNALLLNGSQADCRVEQIASGAAAGFVGLAAAQ